MSSGVPSGCGATRQSSLAERHDCDSGAMLYGYRIAG
jgi:hypothetical protein